MRPFPFTLYFGVLLALFLLAVFIGSDPAKAFDTAVFNAVQELRSPFLDAPMRAVSFLGETGPSIIVAVPFAVWLWVKGFRREAVWFVIALAAVAGVTGVLKEIIDRPRPDGGGLSFVSGHTSYFTVFAGYLFFTLQKVVGNRRWLIGWRIGLVALVVLTGFSRVYLGAHWPTDVLGGFLLGILLLAPVLRAVDNQRSAET
ncbi:phosphatase PAP2 family protein [Dehalogenimonas sp. 4OHTPN]|uniref:Phosphatase PAP2 family protein n=1 Tax=Dehalogenimonas sp. 4OHTPN TaxID=3166643 RepID=A0AAU8GCE9_9CHLR